MNSESVSTQTFNEFQNSQNILSVYFALYSILHWTFLKYFFSILSKKQKLVGIRMKFPLWSLGGHLQSQLECRAVKSSLLLEVTNYLINLNDQTKVFITSGRFSWTELTVSWTQEVFKFKCCCRINCGFFFSRFHTCANVLILAQRRQTCQYSCVLWVDFLYASLTGRFLLDFWVVIPFK